MVAIHSLAPTFYHIPHWFWIVHVIPLILWDVYWNEYQSRGISYTLSNIKHFFLRVYFPFFYVRASLPFAWRYGLLTLKGLDQMTPSPSPRHVHICIHIPSFLSIRDFGEMDAVATKLLLQFPHSLCSLKSSSFSFGFGFESIHFKSTSWILTMARFQD